jgi:hypothetical protein
MSVITKARQHAVYDGEIPERCFYCHELLDFPVLLWMGSDHKKRGGCSFIFLHALCAKELAIKLLIDVQTYERFGKSPNA